MLPGLPFHISTLAQNLLQPCNIATFILYVDWPSIILCGHIHSDSHPGFQFKLQIINWSPCLRETSKMMHDDPPDHLSEPSPFEPFWGDASQEGLIEDAGTGTANGFAALPDASQVDWRAGRDVERVLARPAKLIWSVPVDVQGTYHSVVLYMHLTFEGHLSVGGHQVQRHLRICWTRHWQGQGSHTCTHNL